MITIYIAHKTDDGKVQTVKEHCENTAKLSSSFSVDELKDVCAFAGLLHDAGKYIDAFQQRINGSTSVRVEHSLPGALICERLLGNTPLSLLVQLCVAGHHTGLPDCGKQSDNFDFNSTTLKSRMKRKPGNYDRFEQEVSLTAPDEKAFNSYLTADILAAGGSGDDLIEKYAFLVRFCFSCLTDADSLDTADFMNGTKSAELKSDFAECLERIDRRLASFSCVTALQKTRGRLQQQVYSKTNIASSVYLMNMPTGSGKTLCSMKFALERALKTGKRRIIYVIPYNSIIDQTAQEFESLFCGCGQVLRHQSVFSYEDRENLDEDFRIEAARACENWDAQIIITTVVQFYESLYANKRAKLRKLHNMADSVLVFDEAHLMPQNYLQPCLRGVYHVTKYLNSEAVFLTATMPDFGSLFKTYVSSDARVVELITDKSDFSAFKKCSYSYTGVITDEELVQKAREYPSSLIVVNSRKAARQIYELCTGKKYHLSTYMSAFDRAAVIDKIRSELALLSQQYPDFKNVPEEKRITVVSTSLIEAGVDLDFYAAFRELAGIDNILQTGGRCNREGKRDMAQVFIFDRKDGNNKPSKDLRRSITTGIIAEFSDISSDEAIQAYYERLFFVNKDEITANSISRECDSLDSIPFASYKMRLIDSNNVSVAVVRDDVSDSLFKSLEAGKRINQRKVQPYCFSVYKNEFDTLLSQRAINDFGSGIYFITNPDYYDDNIGVMMQGKDIFI